MKVKIIILLAVIVLFSACMGEDGADGDAYLRIYLGYNCYNYWDNNGGIPYGFYEGQYYDVNPGTYDYEYEDDDFYYSGTYVITIEEGEDGEPFWVDGEDGADSYFTLNCYSDKTQKGSSANGKLIEKQKSNCESNELVDEFENVIRDGNYKMTVSTKVFKK